jgi:hypothetical protein
MAVLAARCGLAVRLATARR